MKATGGAGKDEVEIMTYSATERPQTELTEEQQRLCDWVARQASTGVLRIRYEDASAALDVREEQLTRLLREMRQRVDGIHEMVEFPIVNTAAPYFDVPLQARDIWDHYRRARQDAPLECPRTVLPPFTVARGGKPAAKSRALRGPRTHRRPLPTERVTMNCTKAKPSLQDLQISCYRVWMKPKVLQKKTDRRARLLLGQFLLGTKK